METCSSKLVIICLEIYLVTNILTIESDRICVVLNIFGVNCTIALDISCVFWQERAYFPSSSQNQVLLCLWYYCFLSSQFLVVENYELSKSTNHHLSVSLTLEFFRTLTWFISFFTSIVSLIMFSVNYLSWWYWSQLTLWQTIWFITKSWDSPRVFSSVISS